ncbi:hypothetical protein RCL1_001364 [Eukaryota sp. TZLM3-RCL]
MSPCYDLGIETTPLHLINTAKTPSTSRLTNGTGKETSSSRSSCFIVAVLEGKNRRVGLAAVDLRSPNVQVCQLSDNPSYIHCLSMILLWDPVEIIVAIPSLSPLSELIKDTFLGAQIVTIQRKLFLETRGLELLHQVVFESCQATVATELGTSKQVLGAASALFGHVSQIQGTHFSPKSLKLTIRVPEGHMLIDPTTTDALEVFSCAVPRKGISLLKFLDRTITASGSRLLRMTLSQPTTDLTTLMQRLDALDGLLANPDLFFQLQEALSAVPDMEFILAQYSSMSNSTHSSVASLNIAKTVLMTKIAIEAAQGISKVLSGTSIALFEAVNDAISHPHVEELKQAVNQIIDEDAVVVKGSAQKTALVFAIKPGVHALLDVARKSYVEAIEDITTLVEKTREEYSLNDLKLHFTAKRGHYLSLPIEEVPQPGTIKGFIQNIRAGKRVTFSLTTLESLNNRSNEALNEVMVLMSGILINLVQQVHSLLEILLTISDGIAVVDLVTSFCSFISTSGSSYKYTRPDLTLDGPIAMKQSRHPILETIINNYVPNDIFLSDSVSTVLITGINMGGKTTLLRQTAVIVLLAHIGCFVPASFCSLPLMSRLVVRIPVSDTAVGDSTFSAEMKLLAHAMSTVVDGSHKSNILILIDELCRSTSTVEGLSLAWSICEHLVTTSVKSLITTHFHQLSELALLYGRVRCCHMASSHHNGITQSLYKLKDGWFKVEGDSKDNGYGIQAAELAGVPQAITTMARQFRSQLSNNSQSNFNSVLIEMNGISEQLSLLRFSTLDEDSLRNFIRELKKKLELIS